MIALQTHSQAQEKTTNPDSVWAELMRGQAKSVSSYASKTFSDGLDALELPSNQVPDLGQLSRRLEAATGWRLLTVPGMIPAEMFFPMLRNRYFPVVGTLRPAPDHLHSFDPDLWHDVFGHLPFLTDARFRRIYEIFGVAGMNATREPVKLQALERIYWYTIEFGLILEDGVLRAFGAGLIPSPLELGRSVSPLVRHEVMDLDRMTALPYEPGELQDLLFVVPSFKSLERSLERWCLQHGLL